MLFFVVRNPLPEPPVSKYQFIEALLLKPNATYLCRTNLGYVVIKADDLERDLEAMVYVEAGLSKEEVRAMEQHRAVLASSSDEEPVEPKPVAKQKVMKKGKAA